MKNTLDLILINIPFFIQIKMINGVSMSLLVKKVAIGTILMQSSTYLNIIFQRG
ncbi:hypothetical protein KPC03_03724 [Klebsiella pneumoniae]|nr:hypothetical protein [Klebsiella pneumoniae]